MESSAGNVPIVAMGGFTSMPWLDFGAVAPHQEGGMHAAALKQFVLHNNTDAVMEAHLDAVEVDCLRITPGGSSKFVVAPQTMLHFSVQWTPSAPGALRTKLSVRFGKGKVAALMLVGECKVRSHPPPPLSRALVRT